MESVESDLGRKMRDALRLYGGDIRVREDNGQLGDRRYRDSFWGDEKAYKTLNALLYPGIDNEFTRISKEKGRLNPIFLRHIHMSMEVYLDIFRLMCQGHRDSGEEIIVKRVERESSLEILKRGQTVSFFSTSRAGYSQSFAEKEGVILLEIHVTSDVPYVDFQEALGEEYKRMEEREVLLPPFVDFSIQETAMDRASGKSVRDLDGRRPLGRYEIKAKGFSDSGWKPLGAGSPERMRHDLLAGSHMAGEAVEAMNRGEWQQDFSAYITLKKQLREYLRERFFHMWPLIPENNFQNPAGEVSPKADRGQVDPNPRPNP